jgi:aspartate/methionine/tyrosine aminotransferase
MLDLDYRDGAPDDPAWDHRVGPQNVTVSASAMNALMQALQTLVDPGAVVVTTTPSCPNLPAVP